MTTEDYRFITTLVLGASGASTTILTFVVGILHMSMSARITSVENRILALEKRMNEFQDEIRTKIDLLIGKVQ